MSIMKLAAASALLTLAAAQSSFTGYVNYTTVPGYFLQDIASTNATSFDYTAVNFGLINQTYAGISATGLTQWQQFEQLVESLNADSALDTVYKVLFLGRHGEGYHNAAETYYGTPAWNCYWSILNGNATATWADADLTPNGITQALIANAFWKKEIATQKIPHPQSYYTSPLTRCLRTVNLTFSDIPTPEYYPFIPEVKEFFREGISEHTCDRRSNKTYIHNRFPTYTFESGFTESDQLWNANLAETSSAQDIRSKSALDSVFEQDDHTWVSVTSHSGEIGSLLRVLGHRTFSLNTGAVIPVLVKAQFLPAASAPVVSSPPARTNSAYCTNGPPITSTTSGCVCSGGASSGFASSTGKVTTSSGLASSTGRAATSTGVASSTGKAVSSSGSASSTRKAAASTGTSSSTKKSACSRRATISSVTRSSVTSPSSSHTTSGVSSSHATSGASSSHVTISPSSSHAASISSSSHSSSTSSSSHSSSIASSSHATSSSSSSHAASSSSSSHASSSTSGSHTTSSTVVTSAPHAEGVTKSSSSSRVRACKSKSRLEHYD